MRPLFFLDAVAAACLRHYGDLSDLCFVFPNKRAGTFFLKALSNCVGMRALLAPEVMAVSDFMAVVSGREVASRIDLLFRLYKVYRSLMRLDSDFRTEKDVLEFDRFVPWGETLLADFDEIDKYDADASQVLRNVRDLRDIEANFLTPEQCDALERLLGRRPQAADVEGFWKTVIREDGSPADDIADGLKPKFLKLWKLMPELYKALHENLEKDALTTPGGSFRIAMRRVLDEGCEALPWKGVVTVGFNLLSASEAKLFDALRDVRDEAGEPYAEFFWDCTGPVLGPQSESGSAALSQMRRYMRRYPMPEWATGLMGLSDTTSLPESLSVAASPSNAAQVKIAAMRVEDWVESLGAEALEDARAAVVVPDENLLLPLVHSLPENLPSVNLTMGYSMRYTAVASFVYHLRRLQTRRRKWHGESGFWHEDFKLFLSHPLVHVAVGSNLANALRSEIADRHLRIVTNDWVSSHSEVLAELLRPLRMDAPVSETIAYISSALSLIDSSLAAADVIASQAHTEQMPADEAVTESTCAEDAQIEGFVPLVNTKIERMLIATYQQALSQLEASVAYHGISMSAPNLFHMVDRMLSGETVKFEGEPLQGLQVMGMLETRALDFDHIIILSMNDKIMPRRGSARSFIPASIRHGYGLPGPNQGEELYTYYFYRLLSRASDVTLVYDARAGEGMRSGGKSRFLMQLDLLHTERGIKETVWSFGFNAYTSSPIAVEKSDEVMRLISQYTLEEGGRNLSASALMTYASCPVKFYYKHVMGLDDTEEAKDYLDPLTQGNIVHDALLNLYMPHESLQRKYLVKRVVLDREFLQSLIDDEGKVARVVRRSINKLHYHLPAGERDRELTGTVKMSAPWLERLVRNVVRCDLRRAPLSLVGCEVKGKTRMKVGSAPEVNMSYSFDRLDIVGEGESARMRIVDYKTGKSHLKAGGGMADLFAGKEDSRYLLQLLTYAQLLCREVPEVDKRLAEEASVIVMEVNEPPHKMEVFPTVGKDTVASHRQVDAEFEEGLEGMLCEIFDKETPFRPSESGKACAYCSFKGLCGLDG